MPQAWFGADAIKDQPPRTPLDPKAAVAYGDFINCAYQMHDQPNGDPLTPPQPPNFPNGYRLTAWINMFDFVFLELEWLRRKQFYGFVATEIDNPHSHVLAVRGTEGWLEWWDDAVLIPVPFHPVPEAGLVHAGFYRIYHSMELIRAPHPVVPGTAPPAAATAPHRMSTQNTFADQVEELMGTIAPGGTESTTGGEPAERHHHFIVTGHSLGAALCTLYVMEHAIKKKHGVRRVTIERVCTFASPRTGLSKLKTQFDALPIDSWRIANQQDIVPKVPPTWPIPYRHVETGYEFSSAGVVKWNPACWHSMKTYQHWLDPSVQLDANCRRT